MTPFVIWGFGYLCGLKCRTTIYTRCLRFHTYMHTYADVEREEEERERIKRGRGGGEGENKREGTGRRDATKGEV